MSRSYKKTPIVKDHDSGKGGKKWANRKVRNYKREIANGKSYRKIFNSWDIHDSIHRYSFAEFQMKREAEEKTILNGGKARRYVMEEQKWKKYYKRK